jgi:tetratricopeptide (TPR) repeat protein
LAVDGQFGQIAKRMGQIVEAMEYARHGLRRRSKSEATTSKVSSKPMKRLLALKEPRDALEAAQKALRLARGSQDLPNELKAEGIVGHCYLALEDFVRAEEQARKGLRTAEALNEPEEMAAFCVDLGLIFRRRDECIEACKWFIRGPELAKAGGNYEMHTNIIGYMMEDVALFRNWAELTEVR